MFPVTASIRKGFGKYKYSRVYSAYLLDLYAQSMLSYSTFQKIPER